MLGAPPGSSFEVFGVDMLVDSNYRPWLVEVNAVPSLARKVLQPSSSISLSNVCMCWLVLMSCLSCDCVTSQAHLRTSLC